MDKNNRIGWTRRDFTWPGVMLEQPLSIVPCARYRHYDSDELLAIVRQVQNKLIKWTEVEKNYIDGITRVPPTAVRKILYPKEKAAEKIEALMVSGLPKMGPQYHCNLPVVAKSAISQPIAAQPAVAQCVAAQPAVYRPVVAQPAVSRPVVAQPAVSRLVVAQPAVAQLVAVQPATVLSAQPMGAQGAVPCHPVELFAALATSWHTNELRVRGRHAESEWLFGNGVGSRNSAPAYLMGAQPRREGRWRRV